MTRAYRDASARIAQQKSELAALRQRIAELEGERDEAVRQRVCYSLAVNRIDDYIEHRGPGSFYGGEIDKKRIHAIFAKLSAALAGDAQEGEA